MTQPCPASDPRPHLSAHFRLAIDGLDDRSTSPSARASVARSGVEEYAEGGENRFTHRFPSRAGFGNLVLKQGAGPGLGLWTGGASALDGPGQAA